MIMIMEKETRKQLEEIYVEGIRLSNETNDKDIKNMLLNISKLAKELLEAK